MIERSKVAGKNARVVYLRDDFIPVDKADATLIKIIFDTGRVIFLRTETAAKETAR